MRLSLGPLEGQTRILPMSCSAPPVPIPYKKYIPMEQRMNLPSIMANSMPLLPPVIPKDRRPKGCCECANFCQLYHIALFALVFPQNHVAVIFLYQ